MCKKVRDFANRRDNDEMKAKNRKQLMRKGAFKKEENGNKSLKTWLWTGLEAVEKVASIVAAAYAFIK